MTRSILVLALLASAAAHAAPRTYQVEITDVKIETDWGFSGRDSERQSEPIHAMLRASVVENDQVVRSEARGGGPTDANLKFPIWSYDEYRGHGDSRFSIGSVPMTLYKYAQHDAPTFALDHVDVDPTTQHLVLHVAFGVHTWFHTIPYEGDLLDKIGQQARDGLFDVVGALAIYAGGPAAFIVCGIIALWEGLIAELESKTAQVPCWGVLRDDMFEVPLPQFSTLITMGGGYYSVPAGLVTQAEPQGYKCPELRVSYHVRVSAVPELIELPPAGPCTLKPVVVERTSGTGDTFGGTSGTALWGDVGNAQIDTVTAKAIKAGVLELYVAQTTEHSVNAQTYQVGQPAVVPTTEHLYEPFLRNFWDRLPMRPGWVTPTAIECTHFTNLMPNPITVLDPIAYGGFGSVVPDPSAWPSQTNLPYVDATTLRLDHHTSIHLYGEYQGTTLLKYRVRYVRRDSEGRIVTDVMLLPTAWPPN